MKNIKKKIVLSIVVVLLLTSILGIAATPVMAHLEDEPFVVDLIAGQNTDVGDITVWNDGDVLYVKYETTDGWYMVETHLAVETTMEEIPQTQPNKKGKGGGNPIPGHFEWKMEHSPAVQQYIYTINMGDWNIGIELYIAAHAEVIHIVSSYEMIISDSDVFWEDLSDIWQPAEPCWTHGSWPTIDGATWIWRTVETDSFLEYNNSASKLINSIFRQIMEVKNYD